MNYKEKIEDSKREIKDKIIPLLGEEEGKKYCDYLDWYLNKNWDAEDSEFSKGMLLYMDNQKVSRDCLIYVAAAAYPELGIAIGDKPDFELLCGSLRRRFGIALEWREGVAYVKDIGDGWSPADWGRNFQL